MAAQSPLVRPKHYDPMFKVDIMLREPTLATKCSAAEVAVDMMALLTQYDVLCRREVRKCPYEEVQAGKTSNFFRDKARLVEDRMRQTLFKDSKYGSRSLEENMRKHSVDACFPRPHQVLNNPSAFVISSNRTHFDEYLTCLTQLNQVASLARQLQDDISTNPRPKYLAHQIALLYQSMMSLPTSEPLEKFKKSIQANFKTVKHMMTAEDQQGEPLPENLRAWVLELTTQLAETVESLPAEMTSPVMVPASPLVHMAIPTS
ncbi:hypothetical protein ACOMHN_040399 [Nucella lapillus]